MTVASADLAQFVDKRVTIVRNLKEANEDGATAEELEGTIMAAHEDVIMFKPKGKTGADLIEVADLEKVDYAEERAKKLSRKVLKPVKFGQARTHLLERHGYTLAQVNAMGEKQAFETHEGIDHEAADLGHVHGEKSTKDEGEADTDE